MTTRELIELLQAQDPDASVAIWDREYKYSQASGVIIDPDTGWVIIT